MAKLLGNAHLRLVTVGDTEIGLQGSSFNAIEYHEASSAHVSCIPIKPSTYPCSVGNVPLAVREPIGEAVAQANDKPLFGCIRVK